VPIIISILKNAIFSATIFAKLTIFQGMTYRHPAPNLNKLLLLRKERLTITVFKRNFSLKYVLRTQKDILCTIELGFC